MTAYEHIKFILNKAPAPSVQSRAVAQYRYAVEICRRRLVVFGKGDESCYSTVRLTVLEKWMQVTSCNLSARQVAAVTILAPCERSDTPFIPA